MVRQQAEERIAGKLGEIAAAEEAAPQHVRRPHRLHGHRRPDPLRRRFPMVDLFFKPSAVRDFLVGLPDNAAPDLGEYGVALALEGLLPTRRPAASPPTCRLSTAATRPAPTASCRSAAAESASRTIPDIVREVAA